jgi:uncharacterized protein (DUF2252 family)
MARKPAERSVTEEIIQQNQGRKPDLLRLKYNQLAQGAFAFFRGTDHLLVRHWAVLAPSDPGPRLLCCGDLHIENFGAFRTEAGEYLFDINDFDEALAAPCSIDLLRAVTSILLGCELWNIPHDHTVANVASFLDAYRAAAAQACREQHAGRVDLRSGHGPIWDLLGVTAAGTRLDLLNRYTITDHQGRRRELARVAGKLCSVSKRRAKQVTRAMARLGNRLKMPDAYRVHDVAERIAGIGSLGLRRFVALVDGDGSRDGCWLIDVKEAQPSSLLPIAGGAQPKLGSGDAERTAAAQSILQAGPPLGLSSIKVGHRGYRVRRLIPDESRSSLAHLRHKKKHLADAVSTLGQIVAWSHYRGIRYFGEDQPAKLAQWAHGPALDAIPDLAARYAELVDHDYKSYHKDFEAGHLHASLSNPR